MRKADASVDVQLGLGLFPGNEGLLAILGNGSLEVTQVFQILDPFLQTLDRLGEGFDFFQQSGVTHNLPLRRIYNCGTALSSFFVYSSCGFS